VQAVKDVSFELMPGERTAIVGESGSGKTAVALALMGLLAPEAVLSGSVWLGNRDILRLSEKQMTSLRGRELAMVYQEPQASLNPALTVGYQVREAIRAHSSVSSGVARQRAIELLAEVGIARPSESAHRYPHEFSGGMQQRVVLAMAMASEPKVLIADEPTTALDVTTQAHVLKLMGELASEHGTAVLLITHDLPLATTFVDNVNVMYAGHIVESTTPAQLLSQPAHPYTIGLLQSVCSPEMDTAVPVPCLPGEISDARRGGSGCPFEPRCRFSTDLCRGEFPPRRELHLETGGLATSLCHYAETVSVEGYASMQVPSEESTRHA
jgi:oligopeptide/dipeptide ABC transporter ATP-binding protein